MQPTTASVAVRWLGAAAACVGALLPVRWSQADPPVRGAVGDLCSGVWPVDNCGLMVSPLHGTAMGFEQFWLRANYMLWELDGFSVPPLVTASPLGTPAGEAGVLGRPTTTVRFGNQI